MFFIARLKISCDINVTFFPTLFEKFLWFFFGNYFILRNLKINGEEERIWNFIVRIFIDHQHRYVFYFCISVQQVINFHSSESSYFSCHFSIEMPFFVILIEYFFDGNLKSLWRNLVTQRDFFFRYLTFFLYSFWYWNFHWLDTMWLEMLAYLTMGFIWETIHGSEALK